jgi:hypothetical protein
MKDRLGKVSHCERVVEDGVPKVRVFVDEGDDGNPDLIEVEKLAEPGLDALPLPGDEVTIGESEGSGNAIAQAFADLINAGKAEPGEYRTYARDPSGAVACEVWCKGDGTVAIKSIKSGSKLDFNGVLIDQQGNITVPGEVTAMVGTTEAPLPGVTLSKHLHPTGVGPSGTPTPGS